MPSPDAQDALPDPAGAAGPGGLAELPLDAFPLGITLVDGAGRVLQANAEASRLLGLSRAELELRTLESPLWDLFHADGAPMAAEDLPGLRALREGRRVVEPELGVRRPDGEIIWLSVTAAPLERGRVLITFSDVSDHHRSKAVLAEARQAQEALQKQDLAFREVNSFLATCGSAPGEDFFQSLARFLAGKLGMDFVCIDQLEGDGLRAQTLTVWSDGRFEDNVAYALKGTPCGSVVGETVCCFPAGVAGSFPDDAMLRDLRAESYVGVTLWDHRGHPAGLIAVIGRRPLADPALAESVLKLVAGRAAGELERRQAEAALKESEASYRRQFTDSSAIMLMIDADGGQILDANAAAVAFYGYPRERLVGMSISEINALPAERLAEAMASVRRETGGRFEFQHRLADGSIREVQSSSSRIQLGNREVLHSIVHDITERKRAEKTLREREEQLRVIFETSEAGIILVASDGSVAFANRRMAEMFGVSLQDLIGTPYTNHLHPSEKQVGDERMRQLIQGQVHSVSVERRYLRQDGSEFWGHLSGRRLEHPDGSLDALVGVITDITERKRMEREQLLIEQKIQQSQKMESLGSLAGGVAHDMNNVLGAILGLASAHLENHPVGSPAHGAFSTILKAARRGGEMVKSLLNLARQNPAEQRELDLNAILREEVHLLERTTLAKVRLQLDLAPDLRPVRGDAADLAHAFMNLCVNAVDAMPENGTLTLGTRNLEGGWVEARVEDTGTGMAPEVLEKALDPFFTTKEVGKGTGLGLSLVYSTVKAHGGKMELQSEPGRGTCVILRFPASGVSGEPRESSGPQKIVGGLPSLKVLLVDDDELIQSSIQAILELLGHRVTLAPSGEEALAKLEAGLRPAVVILDMNMPGLGGAGTLPRLRALLPDLPVLLATGRADQTARDLTQAHAGVTLLAKPFSMGDLQRHLEPFTRR
ncbi:hypothetical protein GETHOR_22880 [Geothrix oryzae]|uniref:histidine kinase n=1 Tax=Geothrix oryzae TaxID=2927975 RepID=A0ABM8DT54_9BACT|nr:PAS domain S-box protein [Geothrix oryzae]BDU70187.1 hypothetical protein GETHOR_22880 [Geothrix oryzae]